VLDEFQTMVPEVPSFKSIVDPMHTALVPVIGAAFGNAFTVTVWMAEGAEVHPFPSVTV
jgi:hypothetical protein